MSTWGEGYSGLRRPKSLLLKKENWASYNWFVMFFKLESVICLTNRELQSITNNNWGLVYNLTAKLSVIAQDPCAFTHVYADHQCSILVCSKQTPDSPMAPIYPQIWCHGITVMLSTGGCRVLDGPTWLHFMPACGDIWYRSTYRGWFLF